MALERMQRLLPQPEGSYEEVADELPGLSDPSLVPGHIRLEATLHCGKAPGHFGGELVPELFPGLNNVALLELVRELSIRVSSDFRSMACTCAQRGIACERDPSGMWRQARTIRLSRSRSQLSSPAWATATLIAIVPPLTSHIESYNACEHR